MTEQHPITPPPELVQEWASESLATQSLCNRAAQWGYGQHANVNAAKLQQAADAELEACCEWLEDPDLNVDTYKLRAARRPKPPSLKEEAFAALGPEPLPETGPTGDTILNAGKIKCHRIIHRALKALPDD